MYIVGIGVVSACGRGVGTLERALEGGQVHPARKKIPSPSNETMFVRSVGQETMTDKKVLKNMRRADRFSKMAVLAAWDAVEDSGIGFEAGKGNVGIILASAFGPQVTAFRFLDEIVDHGEASVSPILFSHSVHSAAASYVASALDNRGPTLTLTQFAFSFHQALIVAGAWMQEGRCESVLVGTAEECGAVMEYICSRKLKISEDGKIRSFDFSTSPSAVPGEGSVFLVVTRGDAPKRYCDISAVSFDDDAGEHDVDLCILDSDGMSEDESCYAEIAERDVMIAGYSPLFGSMMTGSAFHCASAALMLMKQTQYACPVQDNPHGVRLCTATEQKRLGRIQCVKYGCSHEKAVIELRK